MSVQATKGVSSTIGGCIEQCIQTIGKVDIVTPGENS